MPIRRRPFLRFTGARQPGGGGYTLVLTLDEASGFLEGTWIRVWPQVVDSVTGERRRGIGGAGRVGAGGAAFIVVPLEGSAMSFAAPPRLDVLAVMATSRGLVSRFYPNVGLLALAVAAVASDIASRPWWVAELGTEIGQAAGQLPPGCSVIALADPSAPPGELPVVVPATALTDAAFVPTTLVRAMRSQDTLIITEPAPDSAGVVVPPQGDLATASSGPNGATLVKRQRASAPALAGYGVPTGAMERREVLAGSSPTGTAVVGSVPCRSHWHELPPSQLGHPGSPAAEEIHGIGMELLGPAAVAIVEHLRERAALDVDALIAAAQTPLVPAAAGSGPQRWSAALETIGKGVAAGQALSAALSAAGDFLEGHADRTPEQLLDDILAAVAQLATVLNALNLTDPARGAALSSVLRALVRLMRKGRSGAIEAQTSLFAAIGRAEDLIYIETPAIDGVEQGTGASPPSMVERLTARLAERKGLRLVLCVPERFLPGVDPNLEDYRKTLLQRAHHALLGAAEDRVVIITPTAGPGRRLYMASTAVIVDDAYAIVGTTHLWRRGLTYDSSVSVAAFDESTRDGRPAAIRALRRTLVADRLGLDVSLVPDDAEDLVAALTRHNADGGFGRVLANAFPAEDVPAPTTGDQHDVLNPYGR